MFRELMPLFAGTEIVKLTLMVSKAGQMTVIVAPEVKDSNADNPMSVPLVIKATPDELDAGFAEALSTYRSTRTTIGEQVAAAEAEIQAAADALKEKSKAKPKALPAPKSSSTSAETPEGDDDDNGEGVEKSESLDSSEPENSESPNVVTATGGTDLAALLG